MGTKPRNFSLRTILFADLVGYSRLVSQDETGTLDLMEDAFAEFNSLSGDYGGELLKKTGDGVLVVFASPSQAVRYAVEIQTRISKLSDRNRNEAKFRIGIHLGEVETTGADIYGHAVNIAARLEAQARPGGVCISHDVYKHARRTTPFGFVAEGVRPLKNIPDAISIYHVVDKARDNSRSTKSGSIQIVTIDGLKVEMDDGSTAAIRSNHVRALLGYLALHPRRSENFDRILALLWPDRDNLGAHRALSSCIRSATNSLKKLGPKLLQKKAGAVELDAARVNVDIAKLLSDVSVGEIADLLIERPDWPESILYDSKEISGLFNSWLEVTRHNWRTRMADALEASLLRFEAREIAAKRAATALLVLEPSHEPGLQKLVEHYASTGNKALAIKTLQNFTSMLETEYQITPSPQTMALKDSLKTVLSDKSKDAPARTKLASQPIILIGQFDWNEEDSANAHLVTGFRSEIIANLSRFRDWIVLENQNSSESEIRNINPDYLLTGQCEKTHSGFQILVILLDPEDRRIIWSERFEVSLENWFTSQKLLVRRIAAQTEIYLSSDRLTQLLGTDQVTVSDYDDWLRGEHLLSLWQPEAEDEAEALFGKIIKRNPHFAPAHASLASIYNVRHLIRPGSIRDSDGARKALPLALRAVEADPLDARNHQVVGWSSAMAGRFQQSSVHYELVANLNASSPKSLFSCAQGLAFVGDRDRARELLEEALKLAPFLLPYQWCYVASTRYMIGDYEQALTAAEMGGQATMDNPGWRAAALAQLDRIEESHKAFEEQVTLATSNWAAEKPPTKTDVLDWFLNAFPIGRTEDLRLLGDHLRLAAA